MQSTHKAGKEGGKEGGEGGGGDGGGEDGPPAVGAAVGAEVGASVGAEPPAVGTRKVTSSELPVAIDVLDTYVTSPGPVMSNVPPCQPSPYWSFI